MSSSESLLSLSKQVVLWLIYLYLRGAEQSLHINLITHSHSNPHTSALGLDLNKTLVEALEGLLVVGYNLLRVACFFHRKLSNINELAIDLGQALKLKLTRMLRSFHLAYLLSLKEVFLVKGSRA
jgi:hypothetical protein